MGKTILAATTIENIHTQKLGAGDFGEGVIPRDKKLPMNIIIPLPETSRRFTEFLMRLVLLLTAGLYIE